MYRYVRVEKYRYVWVEKYRFVRVEKYRYVRIEKYRFVHVEKYMYVRIEKSGDKVNPMLISIRFFLHGLLTWTHLPLDTLSTGLPFFS